MKAISYTRLQQALPLLDVTETELRVLMFITANGKGGCWTIYHGPNLGQALGLFLNRHSKPVERATASLIRKHYLGRDTDLQQRPYLHITDKLIDDCETALQRMRVRTLLGPVVQTTDAEADRILDLVKEMTEPKRFSDRVRLVAHQVIDR